MDEPTTPLPIQFQILYNYHVSSEHDALRKNSIKMYPAFACELNGTRIYRLMERGLDEHYVSAGQLWKACGLTLTEGLFLFDLSIAEYEVDFMIPHFPFCDIWVTVPKARHMASFLDVQVELELLCPLEYDLVFSWDNIARGELVHNWKLDTISNALYSTRALLETPVTDALQVQNLQHRTIRTQISRTRQPGMVCKDRLETGLVRMAVDAYEQFLLTGDQQMSRMNAMGDIAEMKESVSAQVRKRCRRRNSSCNNKSDKRDNGRSGNSGNISSSSSSSTSSSGSGSNSNLVISPGDAAANALWDVFQGILCDLQNQSLQQRSHTRVFQDSMIIGNMPLKRKYLAQSRTIQNVFVAGMLEKMVNEIGFTQQQQQETQPLATLIAPNPSASCLPGGTSPVSRRPPCQQQVPITASVSTSHHSFSDSNIMIHDRMDMLEQEIHKMKRKAKRRAEDLQLETQQLEQKIVALETWKVRNERSRKSERLWILMGCVTVLVVLWIIRT